MVIKTQQNNPPIVAAAGKSAASIDGWMYNILVGGPRRVGVGTSARFRLFLFLLLAPQEASDDGNCTSGTAARVEAVEDTQREEEPCPPRPSSLPAAIVPVVQVARAGRATPLLIVAHVFVARGARISAARFRPSN